MRDGLRIALLVLGTGLLLACGCGKPGGTTTQPAVFSSYDPRKDPLVNPPSLFEPAPEDHSKIATDETLTLQLDGSPNTLSPLFTSTAYEFTMMEALYSGPFTFGKDMKWKLDEKLAEAFEESDDHTTITARLKPGLKWHDGHPFTAHDIVYSWEQIRDPQVPAVTYKDRIDQVSECVAVDDLTVKYVLKEPSAISRWDVMFPIIPRHVFEKEKSRHPDLKSGDYYSRIAREPVGNGPFRLVEWRENDRIIVERWEDYIGKKPYFKRVVFRIIPDNNVALLSFEKEDIDAIARLSAQQFAKETNTPTFARVGYKGWGTEWGFGYIGYNMDGSNPFFNDKRVRYAMTHALNIPLILDKVFYNLATPCLGEFHPDAWMFNPEVKAIGYDPGKSAALLDEAGWKVDPKDGWRYREVNGKRVRFEFTLLMPQGSPAGPKIAQIFQEDLKKLGVLLSTREMEWAAFHETVQKHEFQAEIAGWGTGTDPDTLSNLWKTDQYKTGRNFGGYSNPRVDELFELGRKEFDFEARRKIYQEIHKLIYDDQPYTWIYNRPLLAAINKRIRGVQLSPRGIFNFDPSYGGWWVPAGQGRRVAMLY